MTFRKMILLSVLAGIVILFISYSLPLVLALLTALLLEPVVQMIQRSGKVSRGVSVTISLLLFFAAFGLSVYWIGTKLVVQGVELAHRLPGFLSGLFEMAEKYVIVWQDYFASLPAETISTIQQLINAVEGSVISTASALTKSILSAVAQLPGLLIVFLVYVVALVLISLDLPRIRSGFMNLFSDSAREKVQLVLNQLNRATIGFLRAQIFLSLMTYVLTLLGLLILDVQYAVVIAFIIMLVDILPILGTGTFIVPWAVYSFLTDDHRLGVGLLVLYLVITVIRRTIEPKVLGQSLGISALAALASLYIGFQILGFIGLILGPAVVITVEALRNAGFLKMKIDF